MEKNERDFLKDVARDELEYIASQSGDTSKEAVKDAAVRSILRSFTRRGVKVEYGKASALALDKEIKKTNVYKWAECVDTAKTEKEFVDLVKANFDTSNASNLLLQTWLEGMNAFGIRWRFKFAISISSNQSIHRSHRKKRTAPIIDADIIFPRAVMPEPKRHWLEEVPEDLRDVVRMMSEQPPTPFQLQLVKTCLSNRFNEGRVGCFSIDLHSSGKDLAAPSHELTITRLRRAD